METEGQATEFLSDEEREGPSTVSDSESENGEGEILDYEDIEDDEVVFTTNNNASLLVEEDPVNEGRTHREKQEWL